MARPRKEGLDYFPLDVDFFNDEKITAIAGEFGLKGEITAIKLLCAIYRNGYFTVWNELLKFKLLKDLPGVSADLFESIVNRLVLWGFFDKALFDSASILTSKSMQRTWVKLTSYVGHDFLTSEFNLIKDEKIPFYKLTDKHTRLSDINIKKWHKISKKVFARDNYTCQYCGKVGGKLEVDHIMPFSRGGSDDINNLVTACRKCNRQKHDKTKEEYMEWLKKKK